MSSDTTNNSQDKWYPPGMSKSLVDNSQRQKPGSQNFSGSRSSGPAISYASVVAKTSPKGKQNIGTGPENYNIQDDDFPALGSNTSGKKPKHVMNINSNDNKKDILKENSHIRTLSVDAVTGQSIVSEIQGTTDKKDAFCTATEDLGYPDKESENFTQSRSSNVGEANRSCGPSDARSQLNVSEPSKKTTEGTETSQTSFQIPSALKQWSGLPTECTDGNQKSHNIPDQQKTCESKMEGERETDSKPDYSKDHRDMFEFFWKSPFSQRYRSEFEVDGNLFNTAEQYMIYQKALLFNDTDLAEQILSTSKPEDIENDIMNFDKDTWEKHCIQIVKDGNRLKFSQNLKLKNHLYSTIGKLLVYAHPGDALLGIGLHEDDGSACSRATWQGKNILGYALTYIRDEMYSSETFNDKDYYTISTSQTHSSTEEVTNNLQSNARSPQRTVSQESNSQSGDRKSSQSFSLNSLEQLSGSEHANHTHRSQHWSGYSERNIQGAESRPEKSHEEDYSQDHRGMFEYFWRNESPFSQWHPSKFKVNGRLFRTAEQYMMYQKALLFGDDEMAEKILSTKDPRQQKKLGRKVRNFDEELWQKHCFSIVKEGNRQKFSQNADLKGHLYCTFDKILVEASPFDRMWGIGLAEDEEMAWSRDTWQGRNLLGYALTEVRNEMMKADGLLDS